jgi:response regulator RpfG family c-di-GMP phosphodiesterase
MSAKILVFNEDPQEVRHIRDLLRSGDFKVFESSRVLEALHILRSEEIQLVLASQEIEGPEGRELRELVESARPGVNVLFVGQVSDGTKKLSVAPEEFRQFVQNSIKSRSHLDSEVESIKEFCFSFVDRLLQIFGVNNWYFFNNDHLVSELSRGIAARMGLPGDQVDSIRMAALLKDLGMIGIHRQLVEEKKRFSSEELMPIKKHPVNTSELFRNLKFPWNVDALIAQHHEHYDGKGYPLGLKGRQISLGARIIAVADSYVAMTRNRPYRNALAREDAVREIVKKAGSQFDPEVVEAFLEVIKELPEPSPKRFILMLERQPSIAALIKLGLDADRVDVVQGASSFDAIRYSRQRRPDLVVADVEMLDREAFLSFYKTLQEIPSIKGSPFIFVVPGKDYPRHFRCEKALYLEKPLEMGELSSAVRKMLQETRPPAEPEEEIRGLTGNIEDFSLADLFQILNLGRKTAMVEVSGKKHKGTVFVDSGNIVHASMDELSGKEAFFEMMGWETGTFRIIHSLKTDEVNIKMDTMHLLLETLSLFDEKSRRREQ